MLSIQGGAPPTSGASLGAKPLSDTQKQGSEDLLSNYDPTSLSDDEAKSLVEGIKELNIQRGSALGDALGAAGFDARGVASQAGIAGGGGPGGGKGPPGGGGGAGGGPAGAQGAKGPDSAAVQTLQSIVEQLEEDASETDAETDLSSLLQQALEDAGIYTSQPIVDSRA